MISSPTWSCVPCCCMWTDRPRIAAGGPESIAAARPDPASVERYGPAYRYPQRLDRPAHRRRTLRTRLSTRPPARTEIVEYIKDVATKRSVKAPADSWHELRLLVDALFLRRYDKEYVEEMKGIADGAAAAGAKYDGRAST